MENFRKKNETTYTGGFQEEGSRKWASYSEILERC
jgi:hypothetical protein